jgi:RNA 2',3'-cyclic 3'-phosphodiesterase
MGGLGGAVRHLGLAGHRHMAMLVGWSIQRTEATMIRLFVAVTLPEPALEACAAQRARVERALGVSASAVRFSRPESLHFTLKFLGWTGEDSVTAIRAALEQAAREAPPFRLVLGGLEAFPSTRLPRVVFLGVEAGGAELVRLAAGVESHVAPLGFPSEARPFAPHVTLLRVREPRLAAEVAERLSGLVVPAFAPVDVGSFSLMQSELLPAGARYSEVARYALAEQALPASPEASPEA